MKVGDPGHLYFLNRLDSDGYETLLFVKREGPGYPGNVGHHSGTNMQEVLRALIDRTLYLDNQIMDSENTKVVYYLRKALESLEVRAAQRHGRLLDTGVYAIETMPFCEKCGHIGCQGKCH